MFAIFRDFRQLVEAVQNLVLVLVELLQVQREAGPALDRLTALELSRHQFEAKCEGTFLKAEGKLKAANNAEARERQLKKSYEKLTDPFSGDGEEVAEAGRAVQPNDAETGEEERVPAVPLGVAPSPKAAAIAAKWGR